MRLLSACGGVKTTVVDHAMQRSPVFEFSDALAGRTFGRWVADNFAAIKVAAEATTRVGRLQNIGQFAIGPLRYLRFNYTTGDAAGQNMTGKATLAACEWIAEHYPGEAKFMLSGNIDTDKKHSSINMLLTRGKRVVAEAVPRARDAARRDARRGGRTLSDETDLDGGRLPRASRTITAHTRPNGLAALFIATGQDVANVAESHAAVTYTQLLENGDYYWSVTLTSLIVGTYGGGTGLATSSANVSICSAVTERERPISSPRSARRPYSRATSRSVARSLRAIGFRVTINSAATGRKRGLGQHCRFAARERKGV